MEVGLIGNAAYGGGARTEGIAGGRSGPLGLDRRLGGGGCQFRRRRLLPRPGETRETRAAAGALCSSTRAELVALRAALADICSDGGAPEEPARRPVIVCLDSQAALLSIGAGPAAQSSWLGEEIWRMLWGRADRGSPVHLQCVPAHCVLENNERADCIAKEAPELPQGETPLDIRTVTCAAARSARCKWRAT